MGRYLFEWYENDTPTREIMEEIATSHGLEISDHVNSHNIDSGVCLGNCYLSEFPGNCSMLVLHEVQTFLCADYITEELKHSTVSCALDICSRLRYAALIITGTSSKMRKYLEDSFGFEVLLDNIMNPHSDSYNYFLIKYIGDR